jgi:hypothetical protein
MELPFQAAHSLAMFDWESHRAYALRPACKALTQPTLIKINLLISFGRSLG